MEFVFDIEANGLNPDKIHCVVFRNTEPYPIEGREVYLHETDKVRMAVGISALRGSDTLIGHKIVSYDIPVLERILDINIKAKLVDTLALSWYLYPERNKHGLESWGETFGIPKPEITDWENLTQEQYLHRCEEDVKINTMLWEKQKAYLTELYGVDGYWDLVEYLTFKMHCSMLQEQNKWKLDVDKAIELVHKLSESRYKALKSLEGVLPAVEVFKTVTRPQKPFKKDGTLSVSGQNWDKVCKDNDIDFDSKEKHKVLNGYKPPKASSHQQIKDWLFSLGWSPQTFKYVPDGYDGNGKPKKRKIPQVKKDDELCPSVVKMIEANPEIKHLEDLGVVSHRLSIVYGFLKNVDKDDYIVAAIQGLTNTLRFKHAICVNIPSVRKPFGKEIRELLVAADGKELCGSDMSSLEDRTKQHYMWSHDKEYVMDMQEEGFDPHLDIAVEAGFITQEQSDAYKAGDFSKFDKAELTAQRFKGKTTNYASTYGAGAQTIATGADATLKEGKALHKAYWERNWSLKAIADDQESKMVNGMLWLYNPVSKFWYVLRSKKDIFSTLNQGTGTYCFDMWLREILKKGVKLLGQFHDEIIFEIPKGYRVSVTKYLKDCVGKVNDTLKLNRDLDVDVDYGESYDKIH